MRNNKLSDMIKKRNEQLFFLFRFLNKNNSQNENNNLSCQNSVTACRQIKRIHQIINELQ